MTVIWAPEPTTARLIAAARPAAEEVARVAQAKAAMASKRAAASVRLTGGVTDFTVSTNGLGALFETGVRPHEVKPKGKVLRLADGRFVTGPVRHPGMAAKPFLRPALGLWPSVYQRLARGVFRGF